MPDVTAHALEEAAQHVSGRLRRKNGLAFAQLQQLELDFFREALILDVLKAKPLDQFASIEVPDGEMGKQHRFLCGVSLLDQRSNHSGDVKTLLAIEAGRQGIRDAFKQIA
uniref:Uncharacterized protein n=1 Tax=uncultured bacterium 1062 TaxID=548898 RepID=B8R8Y6_9BACT|nr:hypothetical protein [uncultured bacterium 1062]